MPRKRKSVEKALKQKGFKQVEGDHHYFIYWSQSGKKTAIKTRTSDSHNDIDDSIMSQMAKQCHLSNPEFKKLIDCPLKQPEYEKSLIEKKVIKLTENVN